MSKRLPARFNLNRTTTLFALYLGLHCHAAMSQETNEQAEDELYEQILMTASKRSTGFRKRLSLYLLLVEKLSSKLKY